MHPKNIHNGKRYDFELLQVSNPKLKDYVFKNEYGDVTIDFGNSKALIALNKALLIQYYGLVDWHLEEGFLCPPIPSRVDYIHHVADLINNASKNSKGLDIGVGANAIYSILGAQVYGWHMLGSDINIDSVKAAKKNINLTPSLQDKVTIIHQTNHAHIFKGVIKEGDFFDFTVCNPPFHNSKEEALKATLKKATNLNLQKQQPNFGGQANELWCNGGEGLFLKRMIKESLLFKNQVNYFTSLVSKKENLPKIEKQLSKLNAHYKIITMEHGHKKTRIVVWSFTDKTLNNS